MKLINLIPQRRRLQLVQQFGRAKLVKLPNGQHELIGGTDADRAAAFEWSTLFAHEIVFTHFRRDQEPPRPSCSERSVSAGIFRRWSVA
ncbi:MAG: hypothetical protein WCH99_06705 [Verrucomicrobiota bacterium]